MLDLLCPVCGGRLVRKEKAWRCENHHCFDVARSGYVNLLPPSASGKRHGDDKRMVAARTAFLSRGYYDHLIGAVAETCAQLAGPDACVLDAGCGEGTYTRAIYDALAAKGGCPQLLGVDLIQSVIDYTDKIYLEFGADTHVEGAEITDEVKEIRKRAIRAGLRLVDCPIRRSWRRSSCGS